MGRARPGAGDAGGPHKVQPPRAETCRQADRTHVAFLLLRAGHQVELGWYEGHQAVKVRGGVLDACGEQLQHSLREDVHGGREARVGHAESTAASQVQVTRRHAPWAPQPVRRRRCALQPRSRRAASCLICQAPWGQLRQAPAPACPSSPFRTGCGEREGSRMAAPPHKVCLGSRHMCVVPGI